MDFFLTIMFSNTKLGNYFYSNDEAGNQIQFSVPLSKGRLL